MYRLCFVVFMTMSLAGGCAAPSKYFRSGFKVGPNYIPPSSRTAEDWIDANDISLIKRSEDLAQWWSVLEDPQIEQLINTAVRQNLTLREAGYRILQARAARAMVAGSLFPQEQEAFGAQARLSASKAAANTELLDKRFFDQWDAGFNLSWELDFWGRFRRAIEAADADLDSQVAAYDQAMITLLADIVSTYVEIRT